MKDFSPPINTRTTDDLLMIAAAPDNWQPEAVEMAKEELRLRNVPESKIVQTKYLLEKVDKFEDLRRAKESYTLLGFLSEPFWTIFEILISWELEKDGYLRKARQQRIIRPVLILLILLLVVLAMI